MTQRTIAGLLAVPLLLALWVVAATEPLPYVTYEPGLTVDVLGESQGQEIVDVQGHRTYRDDGQLRMTTVYVSQPDAHVTLFELVRDWLSPSAAVFPRSAIYDDGTSTEENRRQGAVEMVSSQDTATAVALTELGYDVKPALEVLSVVDGAPADGKLQVRDVFLRVDGEKVTSTDDITKAVEQAGPGDPVRFLVRRDGEKVPVSVVPAREDGEQRVGISLGAGYTFPFKVSVDIPDSIGGPSAGLMFSLAIYDTLTPGSLTSGETIAGTGTVDPDGKVGPIGGIQQKIAAAERDGAELFLVPPDNCAEALDAPHGDVRLVRAPTMHDAVTSLQAWADDHDADLPSCQEDS